MAFIIDKVQIGLDKTSLEVAWGDGHVSRFHVKWLRFYCQCKGCVPKYKGTYLVDIPAFPEQLSLLSADLSKSGTNVSCTISGEIVPEHVITHPSEWLRRRCNCDSCLDYVINKRDVISRCGIPAGVRKLPEIGYKELADGADEAVFRYAKHIMEEGFCIVKDVPCENGMILEVAKKLAPILETTYGPYIDINFSGKEHGSNNKGSLPLHMDQASYENCPGVLLLHCMRFDSDVHGGLSKITDVFHAAKLLRKESPEDFDTLTQVPGSYDIVNYNLAHPCHMEQQKRHIVLDYFGKIVAVTWNPDQSAPVRLRHGDVERYFKAHRKFSEILNRKENQIIFRMEKGDIITLNNRRCAHARTQIVTETGKRHLQTCFLNLDQVKSKYMYLGHKLGKQLTPPKVGNSCSF